MDMPITKPSMVAYADELEFSQLIEELSKTKKNGFIRVTSGSEDGYLLFKDGKQVAASYDNLSKLEALDKIKQVMEDYKTLVEVFDIRPSQVSYLMDLNKPYLLEKVLEINEVLEELKKDKEDESKEDEISKESEKTPLETESLDQPSINPETEITSEDEGPTKSSEDTPDEKSPDSDVAEKTVTAETSSEPRVEEVVVKEKTTSTDPTNTSTDQENKIGEESPSSPGDDLSGVKLESTPASGKNSPETTTEASSEVVTESSADKIEISESESASEPKSTSGPETNDDVKTDIKEAKISGTPELNDNSSTAPMEKVNPVETAMEEPSAMENEEPMDRTELLKKYGIKDIDEEDVEKVLESYTGGYLSDNDVEKVELTLMNRVKKSIMGLPKVKGTEVMIFLDNAGNDLRGNINVIMEYQSQGFLSRIVGGSKEINNLKRQVIGICNMEIRKIFREYPEVVDKFEINVEIS